jgi:MFS family permease
VLDDFRDAYGIGGGALGFIVGVGFFSSFFAQVLLAPLADRGHARMLVVAGLVLQIVGLIGMAVGRDVVTLSLARVVMGLGAGALTPAARRIVILAEPDRLGTNVGRLLAADVVGFSIGRSSPCRSRSCCGCTSTRRPRMRHRRVGSRSTCCATGRSPARCVSARRCS